jgi:signal transduction histidine kinase
VIRWVDVTITPVSWAGLAAVLALVVDITDRRRGQHLQEEERRILELIGRRHALPEVLDAIARAIEAQTDGMLASILLLDPDGVHLRHGAAPSLPESYVRAIDGVAIGPDVGSCGTAAYLREPAIAAKIQSDPRWADYRDLASRHGLQACWSTPIVSGGGEVLGTFALYYREPREPGTWEIHLIEAATRLARTAIEASRVDAAACEAAALRVAGHLANAAAHEINNPLTTVVGRLEMLAERLPPSSPLRDLVVKARAASDQIRDVVTRMHQVTRLEYLVGPEDHLPPIVDLRRSSDTPGKEEG